MGRWDDDVIEHDDTYQPGIKREAVDIKVEEKSDLTYSRERSRSPPRGSRRDKGRRSPRKREGSERYSWGKRSDADPEGGTVEEVHEPEPDFGLSGVLAAETNTVNGVVLKYSEPPEKDSPSKRWRLYVFKSGKPLDEPLMIHRQSWYLFGRDRRVVDIPTDHPSCSLQHAVLQYRKTEKTGKDGVAKVSVRPYLMDLGSTNGTFLNGERIEPKRYYELLPKDVLTFGSSTREFVLLVEK